MITYIGPVTLGLCGLFLLFFIFNQKYEPKINDIKKNLIFELLCVSVIGFFIPSITTICVVILFRNIIIQTRNLDDHFQVNNRVSQKSKLLVHNLLKVFILIVKIVIIFGPYTSIILILSKYSIGYDILIGGIFGQLILLKKRKQPNFSFFYSNLKNNRKIILSLFVSFILIFSTLLNYINGLALHPNAPSQNPSPNTTTLRIVTYNILYDSNPNIIDETFPWEWEYRKPYLIDYMKDIDPEIWALQECFPAQIEYFLDHLDNRDYRFCGYGNTGDKINTWNNPIFYDSSLYTYIDGDTFWHSNSPGTPDNDWLNQKRICTWARFEKRSTNAQFCIFNTHFGFNSDPIVEDDYQCAAADLVKAKIIQYSGGLPSILLGDFNLNMSYAAYPHLIAQDKKPMIDCYAEYHSNTNLPETIDTYSGITYGFNYTQNRIDMIFTTADIEIIDTLVSQEYYEYQGNPDQKYHPSDHFPVILDCKF